jgi:Replication-relaxation
MPAKNGFVLTDGDINHLRDVHYLGLASIDNLAALSPGSLGRARSYTSTQKRTAKLAERGYLDSVTRPPYKTLYALGKEGIATLVELGHAPEELLDKRPRHTELRPLFLEHLILIKNIQTKLLLLTRSSPRNIALWREDHGLYDAVTIHEQQGEKATTVRIPIRPDALFVLHDTTRPQGKNLLPFVLEADRSTESHERLRTKIKGYVHYYQHNLAFQKWGYKFFRVLTVTKTPERAANLRDSLQPLIPPELRPHYLFTPLEALSLDALLI